MGYIWDIYGIYMEYIWIISEEGTAQIRYGIGTGQHRASSIEYRALS
jgi:hypothetical protein